MRAVSGEATFLNFFTSLVKDKILNSMARSQLYLLLVRHRIAPLQIGHEQVSWHKNIKYLGVQCESGRVLQTDNDIVDLLFENFMLPPMLFVVM